LTERVYQPSVAPNDWDALGVTYGEYAHRSVTVARSDIGLISALETKCGYTYYRS